MSLLDVLLCLAAAFGAAHGVERAAKATVPAVRWLAVVIAIGVGSMAARGWHMLAIDAAAVLGAAYAGSAAGGAIVAVRRWWAYQRTGSKPPA